MAGRADPVPDPSKLTYEGYVTLPDDGRRYEILDGDLAVTPSPAKLCARFGVEHYWLVDPVEGTLETFHLGDAARATGVYMAAGRYAGDAVVHATLFPSLTIDLAQVWR